LDAAELARRHQLWNQPSRKSPSANEVATNREQSSESPHAGIAFADLLAERLMEAALFSM
ncbi:MAG: hypothetical protein MUF06_20355, partial [Pirellulaceae bacterium]|nr:hypothetical protein [Pirellulaceae bacterium]